MSLPKVITTNQYSPTMLKNKNLVIIGENHYTGSDLVIKLIKDFKPEYYLTEHIQYDFLPNLDAVKKRCKMLTDKADLSKDGITHNIFTKQYLQALIDNHIDIAVVGCDYLPTQKGISGVKEFEDIVYCEDERDIPHSFELREKRMLALIDKYSKLGKTLVSIGDAHLRFWETIYYGNASPITKEYYNRTDTLFMRNPTWHEHDTSTMVN